MVQRKATVPYEKLFAKCTGWSVYFETIFMDLFFSPTDSDLMNLISMYSTKTVHVAIIIRFCIEECFVTKHWIIWKRSFLRVLR